MSDQVPEQQAPSAADVLPPEQVVSTTLFTDVPVNVRRNDTNGLWEVYVSFGGIDVVIHSRKLGGIDDDLQEAATPGFKEKRRLYYEREVLGLR